MKKKSKESVIIILPSTAQNFFPMLRGNISPERLKAYIDQLHHKFQLFELYTKKASPAFRNLYHDTLKNTKKKLRKSLTRKELLALHHDLKKVVRFMKSIL